MNAMTMLLGVAVFSAAVVAALMPIMPQAAADCQDDPCPEPPCCNGDVDANGSINIGDAVYVLTYLFLNGPNPSWAAPNCTEQPCENPPCCNGDADGNGSMNIGDAVYLLTYLFLNGPAPVQIGGQRQQMKTLYRVGVLAVW